MCQVFHRDSFLEDLYQNADIKNKDDYLVINQLITFLEGKVYSAKKVDVKIGEFAEMGSYPELLKEMKVYDATHDVYKIYALFQLGRESIKHKIYALQRSQKTGETLDLSLENMVSICVACGMSFDFTNEAVNAFCGEIFSGRSLRKLLLRGIAKGFLSFGEFAYNCDIPKSFGQYEKIYTEAYDELKKIPDKENLKTKIVVGSIDSCSDSAMFFSMLKNPKVRHSFLYDSVDIAKTVEQYVEARRKPGQSNNELFEERGMAGDNRNSLLAGYERIVNHNCIQSCKWFVDFCKAFDLTNDEIIKINHTLHINTNIRSSDDSAFMALLKEE